MRSEGLVEAGHGGGGRPDVRADGDEHADIAGDGRAQGATTNDKVIFQAVPFPISAMFLTPLLAK